MLSTDAQRMNSDASAKFWPGQILWRHTTILSFAKARKCPWASIPAPKPKHVFCGIATIHIQPSILDETLGVEVFRVRVHSRIARYTPAKEWLVSETRVSE